MTNGEIIATGITIAGLVITVLGGLIGLAFKMGTLSRKVEENTEDIKEMRRTFVDDVRELRKSFVVGADDFNRKMEILLKDVGVLCNRTSKMEQRMDDKNGKEAR